MRSIFQTALLSVGLLVLVAAGIYFYSREGGTGAAPGAGLAAAGAPAEAPPAVTPEQLGPEFKAALDAFQAGRFEEARDGLNRITENDPAYLMALQNLGAVYLRLNQPEEAVRSLVRLTALEPDDPRGHKNLAWAYFTNAQFDQAEIAVLHALELAPQDVQARYHVALYRVAQGNVAAAIRAYQRAMSPGASTHHFQAQQDLERLREAHPEIPEVYYALAFFSNTVGNSRRETEELERYLAMNPEGPSVENARSRLVELRGLDGS